MRYSEIEEIADKEYNGDVIRYEDDEILPENSVLFTIDLSDYICKSIGKVDFSSESRVVEFLMDVNCRDMYYDSSISCLWVVKINDSIAYIATKENPVNYYGDAQNTNVIAEDEETLQMLINKIEEYNCQ